jgi:hypothetical protein
MLKLHANTFNINTSISIAHEITSIAWAILANVSRGLSHIEIIIRSIKSELAKIESIVDESDNPESEVNERLLQRSVDELKLTKIRKFHKKAAKGKADSDRGLPWKDYEI